MRRIFLIISGVCFGLFLIAGQAKAQAGIAYVDLETVFEEYNKTKTLDKSLDDKQRVYEKEREDRIGEIRKMQERMSLLSEQEQEASKNKLEEAITQLQEFDRSATQDLRKQRDESVQVIFEDIKKAIEGVAKKQGLTFVFDKRALMYGEAKLDITSEILKILNKR